MYDDANDDDPQDDDEKALQEALALSMMPDAPEAQASSEQKPAEVADNPQPQPEVDIDADLMKNVIGDLGIDIDPSQLDEIMNEAKNDAEKEKDKEKEDQNKKK
jgi:hypothetical protein